MLKLLSVFILYISLSSDLFADQKVYNLNGSKSEFSRIHLLGEVHGIKLYWHEMGDNTPELNGVVLIRMDTISRDYSFSISENREIIDGNMAPINVPSVLQVMYSGFCIPLFERSVSGDFTHSKKLNVMFHHDCNRYSEGAKTKDLWYWEKLPAQMRLLNRKVEDSDHSLQIERVLNLFKEGELYRAMSLIPKDLSPNGGWTSSDQVVFEALFGTVHRKCVHFNLSGQTDSLTFVLDSVLFSPPFARTGSKSYFDKLKPENFLIPAEKDEQPTFNVLKRTSQNSQMMFDLGLILYNSGNIDMGRALLDQLDPVSALGKKAFTLKSK